MNKKLKLLTSLGVVIGFGGGITISASSCSKKEESHEDVDVIVETDNYLETKDGKYYLEYYFNPNVLCGTDSVISFISPTASGKGIKRKINKSDVTNIIIKSTERINSINDYFLNGFTNITTLDLNALSVINNFGKQFLFNCDNLLEIDISTLNKGILPFDANSFATTNQNAACYKKGIRFIYPNDDADCDTFIWERLIDNNSNSNPYRYVKANFNGLEYDGKKMILENNISPNMFAISNDGTSFKTITYNLKKCGTSDPIYYSDVTERQAVTQVLLGSSNNNITTIDNYFLCRCNGLTYIDLSGLNKITQIGESFLSDCRQLTSIDLSSLKKLKTIEKDFMFECMGLTSINLSGLSQVTSIGNYFLKSCNQITSIDLSELNQISTIGKDFLYWCNGLQTINLFDKSPKQIEVDSTEFMELVPEGTILYCKAEYENDYKTTDPWSKRSKYIEVRQGA